MSEIAASLPFTAGAAYATSRGGNVVGKTYIDAATGYEYVFVQMFTDLTNNTSAVGEIAVQVSATQKGIVSNKPSIGLNTSYPIGIGVFISIIPESNTPMPIFLLRVSPHVYPLAAALRAHYPKLDC